MKNNIIELREKLGLDKAAFGAKVGVTRQTVLAWEKGSAKPSMLAERKLKSLFKRHGIAQ